MGEKGSFCGGTHLPEGDERLRQSRSLPTAQSLISYGLHGIDLCGSPRREPTREAGSAKKHSEGNGECERIGRGQTVKQRGQKTSGHQCCGNTQSASRKTAHRTRTAFAPAILKFSPEEYRDLRLGLFGGDAVVQPAKQDQPGNPFTRRISGRS